MLTCLAVVGFGARACACCAVSTLDHVVRFASQSNIIIWDPVSKTEHFVRNARFTTDAKDFGFIAPTPTKPTLSKASGVAFKTLASLQPASRSKSAGGAGSGGGPGGVEVLEVKDVSGYRATVLKASDSKGLADWMKQNGYATTPAIEEWTKFYISKGWYLTAFKVLNQEQVAQTGVIRLSFKTDRPFNPYYVPKDNLPQSGMGGPLTVFFVAPGQYVGEVEKGGPWVTPKWTARLPEDDSEMIEKLLELERYSIPEDCTITTFEDHKFPSAAAKGDIYFKEKVGFAMAQFSVALGWAGVGNPLLRTLLHWAIPG